MTKFFKASLAALALSSLSTAAVAQKIAAPVIVIVDMDRVVNDSAAGKQAGTEIQAKVTNLQTRGTTLQNQLKTEADAIQAGQANKSLAGAALEQRVQAFGQKQQQAQQELGQLESDIQRSRQYVIKQITDAANPILTTIMKEKGASIALAEEATLQHSAALDVTNDLVTRLNTSLPRVSITPPAAPPAPVAPAQ